MALSPPFFVAAAALLLILLPLLELAFYSPSPTISTIHDPVHDHLGQEYSSASPFLNRVVGPPPGRLKPTSGIVKKGTHCDVASSECNGLRVKNGTVVLMCCKNHCRDIRGDRNNCGQCGKKCLFGEFCCDGVCTCVADNVLHCGKCKNMCPKEQTCENGVCGYA